MRESATHANPVFVALDTPDLDAALSLAAAVRPHVGGLKVGLELFCAHGPDAVRSIVGLGLDVFLDLKLHDIPNTVAKAVTAVTPLGVRYVTVHTGGGAAMLRAAVEAAHDGPQLLGVTVLTSLDSEDLAAVGQHGPSDAQVARLADLAVDCGLSGLVAAPTEIRALRRRLGSSATLVIPGIRPDWAAAGDQKRIMTPREARSLGADILVIGRPVTASNDPTAAAARIAAELDAAPAL